MTASPILTRRRVFLAAILIVMLYLALAGGFALTKRPWCDEACFANPGVDLITRGKFGYTEFDPTGNGIQVGWLYPNVHERAYFLMPFDPVLQAVWYKFFGIHVFTMRSLHILLGMLALLAWGVMVHRLGGATSAALLAMLLIALDRGFLQAASDGRADMASAAFAAIGLGGYAALRERRLGWAILAANAGLAAAGMCHPNGAIAAVGWIYLVLALDRRRLQWRYLIPAAVPYLVAFGAWGWYISQDPASFRAQFLANASTNRFVGLAAPFLGFWREVAVRYLDRTYLPPYAHGWRDLPVLIPLLNAAGVLLCLFAPGLRKIPAARHFGRIAALYFVTFSLGEGTKAGFYLVHVTPVLCCAMALWIDTWLQWPGWRRVTAAAAAAVVIGLELLWSVYIISRNPYRSSYLEVTNFIKQHAPPNAITMGGGELGFELGFYGPVIEDATLGFYSGKRPDFVVVDEKCYRGYIDGFPSKNQEVFRHVQKVLNEDCEKVLTSDTCDLYARKGLVRRSGVN